MTMPEFASRGVRWVAAVAEAAARLASHAGRRVEVVDLQPFARDDAWLLRAQLARLRPGTVRHWACAPDAAGASHLLALPESARTQGLETRILLWAPGAAEPARRPVIHDSGLSWRPRGPVLFVAGDEWRRLEHDLLGVHYGKILRWDEAAWAADPEGNGWIPAERVRGLAAYLGCVNSAPIPVPAGALRAIEAMEAAASPAWMAIARAPGWEHAADARDPDAPRGGPDEWRAARLPVNFDWLAARCREAGFATWHGAVGPHDIAHVVAAGGPRVLPVDDVARLLRDAGGDPEALAPPLGAEVPPAALLALLRASGHEPRVLAARLPGLAAALARLPVAERAGWRAALAKAWRNGLAFTASTEWLRGFADAGAVCGDPALAAVPCEALRERGPVEAQDIVRESHALAIAGKLEEALPLAALVPSDGMHDVLRSRMKDWGDPWRRPVRGMGGELCLEPLGLHHADALAWQQRDEQTAMMTGLPHLKDARAAATWIFGHAKAHPATWAVVHSALGVAGYGELRLVGDMGYLCLWIGLDHQGRGLGGEIVRMLCETGMRGGLRHIFTSAFDDNVRSLRALRAAGMHDMHARVQAPNDDRVFLCLSARESPVQAEEAALHRYMKSVEGAYPIHFPHLEREEPQHEPPLQPA